MREKLRDLYEQGKDLGHILNKSEQFQTKIKSQ